MSFAIFDGSWKHSDDHARRTSEELAEGMRNMRTRKIFVLAALLSAVLPIPPGSAEVGPIPGPEGFTVPQAGERSLTFNQVVNNAKDQDKARQRCPHDASPLREATKSAILSARKAGRAAAADRLAKVGTSTLVLYDTTGPYGFLGELYAMATANLAGHFGT